MDTDGAVIRSVRVLRGPNFFAHIPVLEVELDIGPYEERPSSAFPGCTERLAAWLPGLQAHECSLGRPGGFLERLRRGTYLAHIVEHLTLELQSVMGFDVAFGRARATPERGVYCVVVAYKEEQPARAALEAALHMALAAFHDTPFDAAAEIERLQTLADDYRLGPSTAAIVAAARARRIPVLRLTETGSLVQLGYGVHQTRIQASETSITSAIAVDMCQDKPLTNRMLRAVGVPVPEGRTATSADEAWEAAQAIGLPVVLKPEAGNQGKGVSVDLRDEAAVRAAYHLAAAFGPRVLVERFVVGDDYRLLVVGGALVAAARREPAQVVGDGKRSVAQLVEAANADPRRRPGHSSQLSRIVLDAATDLVLQAQGLTRDSVPKKGHTVRLRTNANLSTGGTASDVTDVVHPANARVARLATQIMGLDIAGIDLICQDIRRPLAEQGGAIVEVNAAPGLRMHLHPTSGTPRDVGTPIVALLYPEDAPARIPILAVTGTNGKTTVTRLIAHIYATARKVVGMTCTEGVYIDGERIMAGDCSGPQSARAVLLHPRVEVAVLETARGGILREGLAFDCCSVAVVTNISADHLGLGGVSTLEELARIKQVVVEAVQAGGAAVLNADDGLVAEMAAVSDAPVIYFSARSRQPVVEAHLAGGGRAVLVEEGRIVLAEGEGRIELVELARVGFTQGGAIGFQVQNALAVAAAAWGGELNPALIARALTTFTSEPHMTPGRFNVTELEGVQIVLDYGHNAAALQALGEALQALGARRTVLALGLPGDRRDEDLRATLAATLAFADAYVLYDLRDRRGRKPGEVPRLLRAALPDGRQRRIVADQAAALRAAWGLVGPGDRVVLIVDEVDEALRLLEQFRARPAEDAACETPIALERTVSA
ncbi:MAG TPA: cyanophycin synthetase [Roseiflexaceae bacterium]|nr:cyanophycin synthetase [Roseiflexaceae bacterium]